MFIPTGADVKSRDKFAEEIEKAKLSNLKLDTGKGYVAIKGKDPQKPRILISFENTRKFLVQKKPATKFANGKIYKNFTKPFQWLIANR